MTDPRTPRTEAGRRIWTRRTNPDQLVVFVEMDDILAIEAEASTAANLPVALSDPDAERQRAIGDREQVLLAALVKAAVSGCHMTSGGTEGVWCIDHDAPWAEPESLVCSDGAFIVSVLDAADPALSDPDAERQRAIGARCPCRASTAAPDICTACGHREHGRLGCDAALSDPDAERQRAIGEAVERLDNATLPSTSLEIQKPSDWTLGLGQTDRKDWLVNVWDGSDSLATALGRDLVEMIDRVIASLSKSSCDCPSFDAEAERDCCCVGGEACRPAAALPAAQEPER
jgi:hypothetical protein